MAINQTTRHTWTAKGRKFDQTLGKPGTADEDISIMEIPRSVNMDDETEPYGKAIDADLAVHPMAALLKRLQSDFKLGSNDLKEAFTKQKVSLALTKDDWLQQLLMVSFGMTFDKNIILKILSQPKCEGMRYYLCLKNVPQQNGTEGKDFLSLVLVGVDEHGRDLHYTGVPLDGVIPTTSLTAEYGHPPTNLRDGGRILDDRYALLNLASELSER